MKGTEYCETCGCSMMDRNHVICIPKIILEVSELQRILTLFDNGFNGNEDSFGFTSFDSRQIAPKIREILKKWIAG